MSSKICLTGIKPTGMPHLGNYMGAIKPAIETANKGEFKGYYFIADYHSLITIHNGDQLRSDIREVAAAWLASGLDPKKVVLYKQSDIPEILELNWIINCFTAKGLMNRAHAYKAAVQTNTENGKDEDQGVNLGLFTYPILMAADILHINSDIVPVGEDQLQHIEIARDIASSFNHAYKKDFFKLPKAIVAEGENKLLPGLDGRKMSKSYNNHIPLLLPEKKLQKTINKIVTDSTGPEEPKDPNNSLIFDMYKFFSSNEEQEAFAKRFREGIGWGHAKAELFNVVNREVAPIRAEYDKLLADPGYIDTVLKDGADAVREVSSRQLAEIKKLIGVS
ncbi:tryptophan--tRNA ligase [Bacteriovorax sp. Seq25_V]|uniref:tryptophan--tRNA ligase n=1 Tax=Bacteriovorax sp. Seq25_V TaxID=1201288 RepID=UPI000389E04A|nr:tryptophan--tRNA ligase [Bacteriovorax sp. Seq25_V]EQC44810.1 tryptophan--tRNA ligase [Bacteriovorax sp. Seq25_V]